MDALPMRYWVGKQRVAFAVTGTAAWCDQFWLQSTSW
jgi:hypothetical protein